MVDISTFGIQLRQFLRSLLGSRLSAHLEDELLRQRADFDTRLLDRERVISDLREQLAALTAKVDRYEMVLLPLASPLGGFFAPKQPRPETLRANSEITPMTWEEVQAENEREQREAADREAAERKQ